MAHIGYGIMPGFRRMKKRSYYIVPLSIFLVTACLILALTSDAAAQVRKGKRFSSKGNCVDCHPSEKFSGLMKHQPFDREECLSCHKPHGLVGMLRLVKEGAALCFTCHDSSSLGMNRSHLHEPAQKGKCTTCHNPHAGEGKGILAAPSPGMLYLP